MITYTLKKGKIKKNIMIISIFLVVMFLSTLVVKANDGTYGNLTFPQGMSREMLNSDYWKKISNDSNEILMTKDQIKEYNNKILEANNTNVIDLESIKNPSKGYFSKLNYSPLYINGKEFNQDNLINQFIEAQNNSTFKDEKRLEKLHYAVATKRCDLKCWPTNDYIGYSADDCDDEIQLAILNVNDPFVIKDICIFNSKTFYYGWSNNCDGWVCSDNLALFNSKEEWINSWKVNIEDSDFLVVTQDKIITEPSITIPSTSEVELSIGTVLKLVPKAEFPDSIGERGAWYNYLVYLPTRDENGYYKREIALIPIHYSVSIGFLDMTNSNILDVAFSCLGDRYGWGGMLKSMDCSLYNREVYECFGFELPRNGTWQRNIPNKLTDISSLSDEEKQEYIESLPIGSLLFFPGHTMIYVGTVKHTSYVISDTGMLSDSYGELKVKSMYSVILNPLTTRRANSNTWLHELFAVVTLTPYDSSDTSTQDITINTTDSIKTETNSQNPSINIVSNNNSNNNNNIINTENIQDSTSPDNIPINTGENAFETCIFFLFIGGILIIALYGYLRSFK